MNSITGEVTANYDGKEYRLYLGMRGIGKLQEEYGKDLAPFMADPDSAADGVPDMGPLVRVVEVSLLRHHPDVDPYLADDLLSADLSLPGRLIASAIPGATDEAAPAGGRAKAARAGKQKARR